MEKISRVAIVGGTHGNEFTGAYLIKKLQNFPDLARRSSFETLTLLANPQAFQAVKRYIDKDLNRCFTIKDLQNDTLSTYEEKQAKFINQLLGPKGNPKVDFILDFHSTTANMGLSIILTSNDLFSKRVAAHLSLIEPSLKVYSWIEPQKESPFVTFLHLPDG